MRVKSSRAILVAALLTLSGVIVLLYMALAQNVIALSRERLVAAEGIGIGPSGYVMVAREMCMRYSAEATVIRFFHRIDIPDDRGSETPQEVLEAPLTRLPLEEGCRLLSRRLDLPVSINPGTYEYRAGLAFRNDIGRSQTAWLTPIEITVTGEGPRRMLRARAKP